MNALKKADVMIDRKMLSEMAIQDPEGFTSLVNGVMAKTTESAA